LHGERTALGGSDGASERDQRSDKFATLHVGRENKI
jgi:hypothetical protein